MRTTYVRRIFELGIQKFWTLSKQNVLVTKLFKRDLAKCAQWGFGIESYSRKRMIKRLIFERPKENAMSKEVWSGL